MEDDIKTILLICVLFSLVRPAIAHREFVCVLSTTNSIRNDINGEHVTYDVRLLVYRVLPGGTLALAQPRGVLVYHGEAMYLRVSLIAAGPYLYTLRTGSDAQGDGSVLAGYVVHGNGQIVALGRPIKGDYYKGGDFIAGPINADPAGHFLYGAYNGNNGMGRYQYRVQPDGSLAYVSWTPKEISYPYVMAFHPRRPFAYVANGNTLSEYHVIPTGKMFLKARLFFALDYLPEFMFTPDGKLLYLLDRRFGGVYPFRVGGDGTLQSLRCPLLPQDRWSVPTSQVAVAPSGRFLYLDCYGSLGRFYNSGFTEIRRYRIDPHGRLRASSPFTRLTPALTFPEVFADHFAYGISQGGKGIVQMRISKDGTFRAVKTDFVRAGNSLSSLVLLRR